MLETLYSSLSYLGPFLFVMTVLVFFHELGHYYFARRAGVKVDVFSIGFGPELFGLTDKLGTRWKFSIIPLGGYVKMHGDENVASVPSSTSNKEDSTLSLSSKSLKDKFLVIGGGPLANIVLGFILILLLYAFYGPDRPEPIIGKIYPNSVAEQAGLQRGDEILSVDGEPVMLFTEIPRRLAKHRDKKVDVIFARNENGIRVDHVASVQFGREALLGITPIREKVSFFATITRAVERTVDYSVMILKSIGKLLFSWSSDGLGGMFSIAAVSHDAWYMGMEVLLSIMALLSLNLGIMNLLPLPVLDGGHLLFYTIEAITGKPVSEKMQERLGYIGLTLIIGLMLVSHWNDVIKFALVEKVKGLF